MYLLCSIWLMKLDVVLPRHARAVVVEETDLAIMCRFPDQGVFTNVTLPRDYFIRQQFVDG